VEQTAAWDDAGPQILAPVVDQSGAARADDYNITHRSFELLLYHVVVDDYSSGESGGGEVGAGGILSGMRILAKHQILHADHCADAGPFQGYAASAKLTILRSQERVGFLRAYRGLHAGYGDCAQDGGRNPHQFQVCREEDPLAGGAACKVVIRAATGRIELDGRAG
jgi:hypothetical protein